VLYRTSCQFADAQAAEDLVQETLLRAWKYFDSFEAGTNCRAWLLRILRNVWADQWRRPRLELPLPSVEEGGTEPYYEWEHELVRDELSEEMQRALGELPPDYRWAVMLADVEELSYREIAEIMACPIGTVMSRINRGRRMLARLLRAGPTEGPPEFETTRSPQSEKR
jgi:RNA polymerase sigma-70 factor (ECF subfamily)